VIDKRVWGREGLTLGLLARLARSFRMVELFHNAEREKILPDRLGKGVQAGTVGGAAGDRPQGTRRYRADFSAKASRRESGQPQP
jgi:hypothetical protein